mgnify:CR=1 FL=1
MKKIITIGLIIFLLISCQEEFQTYSEINNPTEFKNGEWISGTDSLSGISFRKSKLAFFENMGFPGDSVYDYRIVDSISSIRGVKNKIGTYLKRMNLYDTLYLKIIEYSDSSLTLNKTNGIETYILKK